MRASRGLGSAKYSRAGNLNFSLASVHGAHAHLTPSLTGRKQNCERNGCTRPRFGRGWASGMASVPGVDEAPEVTGVGAEMAVIAQPTGVRSGELGDDIRSMYLGRSTDALLPLEDTIATFRRSPVVPRLHQVAQKKYSIFCRNRTAQIYSTFWELVGVPDLSEAKYMPMFCANVPFPGKMNERSVAGMVKDGTMHGVIRYEYKGNVIEECRKNGLEHGLRVVCTQMGDIWIRLFSDGRRLAQVVLNADYTVSSNPKPIDDGGLKMLRCHMHLVVACFEAKLPNTN